ncbi:hypothetical protein MHU86_15812 [Fragilaria crotonensis]|nr:hypothetical protein MHU86_15812 [Fragilaria crotonensis]
MHLVPVIQLENRNRKTTLPPTEEAAALTGVRRFVSANMHLVPGIQLDNRIARRRRHRIPRKPSQLPECGVSKTLQNSMNSHEVVEIANKMCWPTCIWFQASNLKIEIARTRRRRIRGGRRNHLSAAFPKHFKIP